MISGRAYMTVNYILCVIISKNKSIYIVKSITLNRIVRFQCFQYLFKNNLTSHIVLSASYHFRVWNYEIISRKKVVSIVSEINWVRIRRKKTLENISIKLLNSFPYQISCIKGIFKFSSLARKSYRNLFY